jgi:FtsH-binding integral membrane protein
LPDAVLDPYEHRIMRKFGYWLGVALLVAAGAAAVAELLTMLQGAPSRLSIGAIWFRIHGNSLVGFQALIENRLTPLLWPPMQWLLTLPAWLVLAPPGLLLVLLCRDRGRG